MSDHSDRTTSSSAARHVYAKNRWHAVWVLIRESFRHPNTKSVIHIGEARRAD